MDVSVYSLLPLVAFLANVTLGCYIIYRNPKDMLSRLYTMVVFSLALWSLADFFSFVVTSPEMAIFWSKFATLGSSLVPAFFMHFFLTFTMKGKTPKKMYTMLLYVPVFIFTFINFTTMLITQSAEMAYWGFNFVRGVVYLPITTYITIYIVIGLLLCYRFYRRSTQERERKEAKFLIIAVSIPLVGGVITEIIFPMIDLVIIPLSTTFTTITAILIAYSMIKYGFMIITPRMVAERILDTISDSVVAVDKHNKISFVNRAATDILDYKEDNLIGKPLEKIMSSDGVTGFDVSKELSKDLKNFETELVRRDKKRVLVSVNASEIKDKRKNVVGHVLVLRDIRETTELIKTLKEKTKELEKRKRKLKKSKRVFVREIGGMKVG